MTAPDKLDDEMPAEIDFSDAVRGKFFRPDAQINLPVYGDTDVESRQAGKFAASPPRPSGAAR